MINLKTRLKDWLFNPTTMIMAVVLIMYLAKAVLKITIGSHINSPMIAGDGFHNLADFAQSCAVIAVILVAGRPCNIDYPFGKKNVEFFSSLIIGLGLIALSLQFAFKSSVGLLHFASWLDQAVREHIPLPAYHALVMDSHTFPWLIAITLGSLLLSLTVGRCQIAIARKSGHASMLADGKETVSDGLIEFVTLAGVLAEYWLHMPWLEYPLGLLIAIVIAHTGWGLFLPAFRVLLQHSIGANHDQKIAEITSYIPGVTSVVELKTFRVGHTAICMVTVTTRANAQKIIHIKYGVEHALTTYLLQQEFKECDLHIKFQRPELNRHRVAFAVVHENNATVIAPTLVTATHILVCDVEDNKIVRTKTEDKPSDPIELLARKHVVTLYTYNQDHGESERLLERNIKLVQATSYLPVVMGAVC